MIDGAPASAEVTAKSACRLLSLDEQAFLETHVYGGKRQLPTDTINAFNRFSTRI